jgi:hypothetical protein
MGLQERRVLKEFEDEKFPKIKAKVSQLLGKDVEWQVDWDKLAEEGYSHLMDEHIPKVYFNPLTTAIGGICKDAMGKEALSSGLTKIVVTNDGTNYHASNVASFSGGVLTLNHEPNTNVDEESQRSAAILSLLEKSL